MSSKKMMFVVLAALVLMPHEAFAYIDPGSGSAILQGVLGALAAVAVVLKLYWHRLLRIFGIGKNSDTTMDKSGTKKTGNQ